jgi:hypothetical protein
MPFKITFRKPSAHINYITDTEESALAALARLPNGVTISDSETGEILAKSDLEDRIEDRSAPDAQMP